MMDNSSVLKYVAGLVRENERLRSRNITTLAGAIIAVIITGTTCTLKLLEEKNNSKE